MFNRIVVHEVLKRSGALDPNPALAQDIPTDGQDSVILLLIHDIFGGEILKTHEKKGWHFYNRINGERIDFTRATLGKSS
ncbi:MAG: hypothetical protein NTV31_05280 [Bacteroidia bacterium]|nr:hypothetical protein [Bacteroidia bacterium]